MATTRLIALLLFESSTIAGLHGLGSLPWFGVRWGGLLSRGTRVDDAVASGLRYVALALAYWLMFSTALYLGARLTRLPTALRAVQWATLPFIRRTVDRMLAVSLTFGTLVAPTQALAQTPPSPVEQVYLPTPAGFDESDTPIVVVEGDIIIPPGAALPQPSPHEETTVEEDPTQGVGPPVGVAFERSKEHEVVAGESLWSIAEAQVRRSSGVEPAASDTVVYWLELLAANRDHLTSGDPDLIYPGEMLTLPPTS
jgi:hypothetical protein